MNTMLSTLRMLIQKQWIPPWKILTSKPSPWGEIFSTMSLNMLQVPRYIGPITRWYCNLSTALTSLILLILVLISFFYLTITAGIIEEEKIGWMWWIWTVDMADHKEICNKKYQAGSLLLWTAWENYWGRGLEEYVIPRVRRCTIIDDTTREFSHKVQSAWWAIVKIQYKGWLTW